MSRPGSMARVTPGDQCLGSPPASGAPSRDPAIDAARGVAVLGMLFMHLVPAQAWDLWSASRSASFGSLSPFVTAAWAPTSIPFFVLTAASAVAVVTGFERWVAGRGLPSWLGPVVMAGRASLSCYVGHICLVIVPLRFMFPNEAWGGVTGWTAFLGSCVLFLGVAPSWFSRNRHGPLEALISRLSGPSR